MSRMDNETQNSFRSWATNITKCTNPAFNRVINKLWSDPKAQKDVIAVLKSITKIIQDRKGKESSSEYFAILISILNQPSENKRAEAYLLKLLLLRAIPSGILRSKFAECTKTLINVLQNEQKQENPDLSTIKSLVQSLGCVLMSQNDEAWAYESTRNVYRLLISYISHEKPAIKKAAHEAIIKIFTNSSSQLHPASHQTVEFLVSQINIETNALGTMIHVKDNDCKSLMRLINILVSIIPYLSESHVKQSFEGLLKIVKFPNLTVVKTVYSQFCHIFSMNLTEKQLSFEITAKLITALHQNRPNVTPNLLEKYSACHQFWLKSIFSGCQHLVSLLQNKERIDISQTNTFEWDVVVGQYDRLVKVVFESFTESISDDIAKFHSQLIDVIFINLQSEWNLEILKKFDTTLFPALCNGLANYLDIGHRKLWIHILDILSRLIRIWAILSHEGKVMNDNLKAFIQNLATIRDGLVDGHCPLITADEDKDFTLDFTDAIDKVFVVAFESFGVDKMLTHVLSVEKLVEDLESSQKLNMVRSWLPSLFPHIRPLVGCNLAFFRDQIIPLIDRMTGVASKYVSMSTTEKFKAKLEPNNIMVLAFDLARQFWSLLSCMLSSEVPPIDWATVSKGGLGKLLTQHLMRVSQFRGDILLSLKRLIQHSKYSDEGTSVLKSGAKMIMPSLLTLYEENNTAVCADIKHRVRQTLIPYLEIIPAQFLNIPCQTALEKFKSNTQEVIFLEIIALLLPFAPVETIMSCFSQLEEHFNSSNSLIKKRVYRIIEDVFTCKSNNSLDFLKATYMDWLKNFTSQEKCCFQDFVHEFKTNSQMLSLEKCPTCVRTKNFGLVKISHLPWKSRTIICQSLLRIIRINNLDPSEQLENVKLFSASFISEILICHYLSKNSMARKRAISLLVFLIYTLANRLPPRNLAKNDESRHKDLLQIEDDLLTVRSMALTEATSALSLNDDDMDDDGRTFPDNRSHLSRSKGIFTFEDDAKLTRIVVDFIRTHLLDQINLETPSPSSVMNLPSVSGIINILLTQSLRLTLENFLSKISATSPEANPVHLTLFIEIKRLFSDILQLATHLTSNRNSSLIVLGLRLVNVIIPFADTSVTINQILDPINAIPKNVQVNVKKYTKKLLNKVIKKFGGMYVKMNIKEDFQKVVTNIIKSLSKEAKKRNKKEKKAASAEENDFDDSVTINKTLYSDMRSVVSGGTNVTRRSALSIPKRVHLERFDELLKDGMEIEKDARERLNELRRENKSQKKVKQKSQNLADELVNLEIENGLSRKSKRRIQDEGDDSAGSSSSYDTEEEDIPDYEPERKNNKASCYIYEDVVNDEVLDLAAPDSVLASSIVGRNKNEISRAISAKRGLTSDDILNMANSLSDPISAAKKRKLAIQSDTKMVNKKLIFDPDYQEEKDLDDDESDDALSEDDESNDDLVIEKKSSGGTKRARGGIRRLDKKSDIRTGAEYTSKKASGDMKRRGKPDPYAYLPLGASSAGNVMKKKKLKTNNKAKAMPRKKHKIL